MDFLNFLENWILHEASYLSVGVSSFLLFSFIYFGLAGTFFLLSHQVFPSMGKGEVINKNKLFDGQIVWELKYSFLSIFIFALYGMLTVLALRQGWVQLDFSVPSVGRLILDMAIIVIWNEVHFYVIHRALHNPWFYKKIHWIHHRSKVCTPLSTYSFHWGESTGLGSVMILAMLFWNFHFIVLMIFPAVSLLFNSIGHFNYTIFTGRSYDHIASASKRHAGHHLFINGNYGFLLPYLDRWAKTSFKKETQQL